MSRPFSDITNLKKVDPCQDSNVIKDKLENAEGTTALDEEKHLSSDEANINTCTTIIEQAAVERLSSNTETTGTLEEANVQNIALSLPQEDCACTNSDVNCSNDHCVSIPAYTSQSSCSNEESNNSGLNVTTPVIKCPVLTTISVPSLTCEAGVMTAPDGQNDKTRTEPFTQTHLTASKTLEISEVPKTKKCTSSSSELPSSSEPKLSSQEESKMKLQVDAQSLQNENKTRNACVKPSKIPNKSKVIPHLRTTQIPVSKMKKEPERIRSHININQMKSDQEKNKKQSTFQEQKSCKIQKQLSELLSKQKVHCAEIVSLKKTLRTKEIEHETVLKHLTKENQLLTKDKKNLKEELKLAHQAKKHELHVIEQRPNSVLYKKKYEESESKIKQLEHQIQCLTKSKRAKEEAEKYLQSVLKKQEEKFQTSQQDACEDLQKQLDETHRLREKENLDFKKSQMSSQQELEHLHETLVSQNDLMGQLKEEQCQIEEQLKEERCQIVEQLKEEQCQIVEQLKEEKCQIEEQLGQMEEKHEFLKDENTIVSDELRITRENLNATEQKLKQLKLLADCRGEDEQRYLEMLDERRNKVSELEQEIDYIKGHARYLLLEQGDEISTCVKNVKKLSTTLNTMQGEIDKYTVVWNTTLQEENIAFSINALTDINSENSAFSKVTAKGKDKPHSSNDATLQDSGVKSAFSKVTPAQDNQPDNTKGETKEVLCLDSATPSVHKEAVTLNSQLSSMTVVLNKFITATKGLYHTISEAMKMKDDKSNLLLQQMAETKDLLDKASTHHKEKIEEMEKRFEQMKKREKNLIQKLEEEQNIVEQSDTDCKMARQRIQELVYKLETVADKEAQYQKCKKEVTRLQKEVENKEFDKQMLKGLLEEELKEMTKTGHNNTGELVKKNIHLKQEVKRLREKYLASQEGAEAIIDRANRRIKTLEHNVQCSESELESLDNIIQTTSEILQRHYEDILTWVEDKDILLDLKMIELSTKL